MLNRTQLRLSSGAALVAAVTLVAGCQLTESDSIAGLDAAGVELLAVQPTDFGGGPRAAGPNMLIVCKDGSAATFTATITDNNSTNDNGTFDALDGQCQRLGAEIANITFPLTITVDEDLSQLPAGIGSPGGCVGV